MRKLKSVLMLCSVLGFVSTVRAQNSGTNNAELNGNYAFTFNGFSGSSGGPNGFGIVGRFSADGAGNVTNGELDTNSADPRAARVAQTFSGTYSIGADHRGVMNIFGGEKFAFAMMGNGNAQFIEFDAGGGNGTIGSGTMEKADPAAYGTAKINGHYAFGVVGMDALNQRAAMTGRFTSDGAGSLTSPDGDVNAYGSIYPMSFTSASYTVSDTAMGRGTMNLSFTFAGGFVSLNFVFYIVNSGKLFAMERDTVTTSTPLLNGVVLQQQVPAGGFSNASLSGPMVIYLTGLSTCGGPTATVPKAVIGLITADGNGGFTLTYDENYCNAPDSVIGLSGTYSVEGDGRTAIMLGQSYPLAGYLVNVNRAFFVGTDSNVLSGFGEPQQAKAFNNGDVNGTYAGSTTTPSAFDVVAFSGEFTADGRSPNGNMTGIADVSSASGTIPAAAFNATYSVSSSPTNGRGTMTITSGSGGSDFVYVISTSKFVAVSSSDVNPAVMIFERSSPSTPVPPPIPRFALTVTNESEGLGSGSVTSQPAGINCGSACTASYDSGTTVVLTAHPGFLSAVGSWTGCDAVSAGGTNCTVNMNAARSVSVSFRFLR